VREFDSLSLAISSAVRRGASISPMSASAAWLVVASNSGHTSWWIGLPVLVVVAIFRFGSWRARGRRGRRGDEGPRSASDERKDEHR
jgi:hypothetical protein